MFCFQIHALAYCTINSKFSILHSASLRAVLKISHSLYSKRVRVFENKTKHSQQFLTRNYLASRLSCDWNNDTHSLCETWITSTSCFGDHVMNTMIHGCKEIWYFSSHVHLDISFVRYAHSWDIELNMRREITRVHVLFSKSPRAHVLFSNYKYKYSKEAF